MTYDDGTRGDKTESGKFVPNALTPFEALVAGGNRFKETLLRRANSNYDKILADVIREMLQQKIASLHYDAINTYVLFAPTMFITLLSAIISIFGTSQLIENPELKVELSIIVASFQLLLSILQSLSKQLNYGARAGFHASASSTLNKMYQNAKHSRIENRMKSMKTALRFDPDLTDGFDLNDGPKFVTNDDGDSNQSSVSGENENKDANVGKGAQPGNEDGSNKDDEEKKEGKSRRLTDDTDSLTKQFKQAVDQVDSFVPIRVANAFNVMESRIRVVNESLLACKTNSLVAWEQVLMALYFQLAETIIESRGFPFVIPGPREAVDRTLANFKEAIDVNKKDNKADLLEQILYRSDAIADKQREVAKKREAKRCIRNSILYKSPDKSSVQEVIFEDAKLGGHETDPLLPTYGTASSTEV